MNHRLVFAYPGRLDLKTGGYAYDRHLIEELRALGWQVETIGLGEGFPAPARDVLDRAGLKLSALADATLVMIDGLAFGVMEDWAQRESARLRLVALVHHPLALETALSPAAAERLAVGERLVLKAARHVVVTSHETARRLVSSYDVAPAEITIALPGTQKGPPAPGGNDPVHIVSIGSLTKRKGHDVLLAALHAIRDLSWRASIIGSPGLDPATAAALQEQVEALGLDARVHFRGEVPDVSDELATGDIFALATRYEGYGMVFAEALARGLPIVGCHAGAVPDVVPKQAGILVPVDDVGAFALALRRLIENPVERRLCADAAMQAGAALPQWPDTARTVAKCLEDIR